MGAKAAIHVNAYQILGDNSRPGLPFLSHKKRQKSHLIFLKLSQRRHEATKLHAGHQPKLQRSTHVNATDVEHVFHMKGGNGETSYAKNSRLQRKAILETKPLLEMAIAEVCTSMTALPRTMVVADLGCSCGPNTLLFVSEVISTVANRLKTFGHNPVEIQFFLNDLPGNDFNHVFRSLAEFHKCSVEGGDELPAYYIAGLPGSFYRRLLPCRSVHLFHSSYCLMWCSQVPKELLEGKYVNKGKICIGATTPPEVIKLYQEQFHRDFSRFLELRSMELVPGGQMVLTILGRKHRDPRTGELFTLYALLAQALQCLLLEGRMEEKLDGINLPLYTPSVEEVAAAVEAGGLFDVRQARLFQSNWDPHDDSEDGNAVTGGARESGENVARVTRAVLEALLLPHLGECVLDELFTVSSRHTWRRRRPSSPSLPSSSPLGKSGKRCPCCGHLLQWMVMHMQRCKWPLNSDLKRRQRFDISHGFGGRHAPLNSALLYWWPFQASL